MRVIYRGESRCLCIMKLEDWYRMDPFQLDDGAHVQCDCGRMWYFRLHLDGSGWRWELDETMRITW